MNSWELAEIRQQAEFIKANETIYVEFKQLSNLIKKNSLTLKEPEIEFKIIKGMLKKDCLKNPLKTQRFIRNQMMLHKKIKPLMPPIGKVLSRC